MLRIKLLSFIGCFVTAVAAFGQGSISGTVTDATSGETIIGANVVIQGTQTGVATDIDGKFVISNIAAGTYTLNISFITYKTHVIPNVVVENGKRVNIDVPLSATVSELQEVVVTGTRQVDTDFELIRAIKESKLIVSGISAEQISKTLDRDAAQVIKRVPGITIRGNDFVQIRGLSERYNPVMLHNAYAPSVETDIRSFSFTTIPSSQLDQLLVFKSPSADIPGDFAGGVVKIFTKSIPDENSIRLDYSTTVRFGTTFNDFSSQERNPGHFTGFNTGYFDLPSSFPANLQKSNPNTLVTAGRSLRNLWKPQQGTAIPDQRFNLTFNRRFKLGKMDIGNITTLSYSNSFSTFKIQRSDFNDYNTIDERSSPIYLFNDVQYNQQIRTGVLFNWSFKFSDQHKIDFKNLYNQSSQDQYVDREALFYEKGTYESNGSFDKSYRGIYSGQLLGTHNFFDEKTQIEWVAGYNKSHRDQPDYKRYQQILDVQTESTTIVVPESPNQILPENLGRFFSKLEESSYTGGISIKQNFTFRKDAMLNPEVKAGVFFENKERTFAARNIGFAKADASTFNNDLLDLPIYEFFQPKNINNNTGVTIGEQSNPNDSYTAANELLAYYVKAGIPITKGLNLDFGVRIEDNAQTIKSRKFSGEAIDNTFNVVKALPSANVNVTLVPDKMVVKASYGKTLNRPEFRELAPFGFYDFNFNFTMKGNENLQTAVIDNYDVRWELYPSKGELISVAGFYKSFTDPIETIFNPGSGSLGAKSFFFANAQKATSYGVEVELKKSLASLASSRFMENMSVMFNAALIKSEIDLGSQALGQSSSRPLQGQAPYVVNAALFYEDVDNGMQVNLLYNVVGKSIIFVGFDGYPDLYLMPRNVLDLTFSKRIGKFDLKGGLQDLLNQDMMILQDGNQDDKFDRKNDQVIQKYKPGIQFSLGFSLRL